MVVTGLRSRSRQECFSSWHACLMASGERSVVRSCRKRPKMVTIRGGTGGLLRGLVGCQLPPGCPRSLPCSSRYKLFRRKGLCTNFVAFGTFLDLPELWANGTAKGEIPDMTVVPGR